MWGLQLPRSRQEHRSSAFLQDLVETGQGVQKYTKETGGETASGMN